MRILPCGDLALLLEFDSAAHRRAYHVDLQHQPIPTVVDQVPGELTLLLTVAVGDRLAELTDALRHRPEPGPAMEFEPDDPVTVIGVHYDGPDLIAVAESLGITTAEVIRRHTGQRWRVDFTGFAPGFGYLVGEHDDLTVPRRAEPRPQVPAGAVGLAGRYSGAYPRTSPGGWQLIGHTDLDLWDPDRDPPALLRPGTTVRFQALRGLRGPTTPTDNLLTQPSGPAAHPTEPDGRTEPVHDEDPECEPPEIVDAGSGRYSGPVRRTGCFGAGHDDGGRIRVLRVGAAATIQDLGRPGYAALGVATSGAADRAALRLANRVVGNPDGAAGIEILLGGLWLEALEPLTVAVTGAPLRIRAGDPGKGIGSKAFRDYGVGTAIELAPGEQLRLGAPTAGLRSYLAIAGGIAAPPVLGSRATDTSIGLGPQPLWPGTELAAVPRAEPRLSAAAGLDDSKPDRGQPDDSFPHRSSPDGDRPGGGIAWTEPQVLRILPGPRADWFADNAFAQLTGAQWTVSPQSDRVGVRLIGPELARVVHTELPSEPMVRGSIQVPPNGQPVIFGADHPTTGGYPVIAVVIDADTDLLAQLRPGRAVRLRPDR